jgi:hypothetical protein
LTDTFHLGGSGLGHVPLGAEVSECGAQILDNLDSVFIAPIYCHMGIITPYSSLVIIAVSGPHLAYDP